MSFINTFHFSSVVLIFRYLLDVIIVKFQIDKTSNQPIFFNILKTFEFSAINNIQIFGLKNIRKEENPN